MHINKIQISKTAKEADLQQLNEVLGTSKAKILYDYFHSEE